MRLWRQAIQEFQVSLNAKNRIVDAVYVTGDSQSNENELTKASGFRSLAICSQSSSSHTIIALIWVVFAFGLCATGMVRRACTGRHRCSRLSSDGQKHQNHLRVSIFSAAKCPVQELGWTEAFV